jgi:hypothetical protein
VLMSGMEPHSGGARRAGVAYHVPSNTLHVYVLDRTCAERLDVWSENWAVFDRVKLSSWTTAADEEHLELREHRPKSESARRK